MSALKIYIVFFCFRFTLLKYMVILLTACVIMQLSSLNADITNKYSICWNVTPRLPDTDGPKEGGLTDSPGKRGIEVGGYVGGLRQMGSWEHCCLCTFPTQSSYLLCVDNQTEICNVLCYKQARNSAQTNFAILCENVCASGRQDVYSQLSYSIIMLCTHA